VIYRMRVYDAVRERRAQLPPIIRAQEETFMTLAPDLGVV
jgi:hypothetical protein